MLAGVGFFLFDHAGVEEDVVTTVVDGVAAVVGGAWVVLLAALVVVVVVRFAAEVDPPQAASSVETASPAIRESRRAEDEECAMKVMRDLFSLVTRSRYARRLVRVRCVRGIRCR